MAPCRVWSPDHAGTWQGCMTEMCEAPKRFVWSVSELDKKKNFLSKKIAVLRGWIQAAATLLTNIHIPNLWKGKIYQGSVKNVCVPGLNCYSCPAATGACPIGAFQAVVGSSGFKFSYYITGFFILLGVTLGRFICGFLCPFGWYVRKRIIILPCFLPCL